jgi:hypothetical protein
MKKYVFVCGNSRSGTTMMARILARHSSAVKLDEIHFFDESPGWNDPFNNTSKEKVIRKIYSAYKLGYFHPKSKNIDYPSAPYKLASSMADIYRIFLEQAAHETSAEIVIEQTPANIHYLQQIESVIPNAMMVVMIRHPLDVLASQKYKWKRRANGAKSIPRWEALRAWLNYNPISISKIWLKRYQHLNFRKGIVVKYEDLVSSPAEVIQMISKELGLKYRDDMLKIDVEGSSSSQDLGQVGIVKSSVGNWPLMLNRFESAVGLSIVSGVGENYGYHLPKPSRVLVAVGYGYYFLSLFAKLPIQLVFNLHRVKAVVRKIL